MEATLEDLWETAQGFEKTDKDKGVRACRELQQLQDFLEDNIIRRLRRDVGGYCEEDGEYEEDGVKDRIIDGRRLETGSFEYVLVFLNVMPPLNHFCRRLITRKRSARTRKRKRI